MVRVSPGVEGDYVFSVGRGGVATDGGEVPGGGGLGGRTPDRGIVGALTVCSQTSGKEG